MSTTTLRLPEPLKQRIAELAEQSGQTAHAFMVEALQEKADEAEWRMDLRKEAHARDRGIDADGNVLEWHEMRTWIQARAEGQRLYPPQPRRLSAPAVHKPSPPRRRAKP